MPLAIFDLDNTLLHGDSDHAWGEFLIAEGLVDAEAHGSANDAFFDDYRQGVLDIHAYQRFAMSYLANKSVAAMQSLQAHFFASKAKALMLPKAQALVDTHREQGDTLLVITATNRFVTERIVAAFGIENLIACEPEIIDDRYTGNLSGTPSFQAGKIARLNEWLAYQEAAVSLEGASFYSDSFNDLPLLSVVDHPVAVDPDDKLKRHALEQGWRILSLRD